MGMPLIPGRPGKTQMSHGKSRYPNPDSDFQSGKNLPWELGQDEVDLVRDYHASLRSDPTNPYEDIGEIGQGNGDMLYVKGNPDIYGPDETIIQEPAVRQPGKYPQPKYRTGVTRQS